jgi:hypothetical protein
MTSHQIWRHIRNDVTIYWPYNHFRRIYSNIELMLIRDIEWRTSTTSGSHCIYKVPFPGRRKTHNVNINLEEQFEKIKLRLVASISLYHPDYIMDMKATRFICEISHSNLLNLVAQFSHQTSKPLVAGSIPTVVKQFFSLSSVHIPYGIHSSRFST